jgi:hypothetical protein
LTRSAERLLQVIDASTDTSATSGDGRVVDFLYIEREKDAIQQGKIVCNAI